jgi:hypothetical protein
VLIFIICISTPGQAHITAARFHTDARNKNAETAPNVDLFFLDAIASPVAPAMSCRGTTISGHRPFMGGTQKRDYNPTRLCAELNGDAQEEFAKIGLQGRAVDQR